MFYSSDPVWGTPSPAVESTSRSPRRPTISCNTASSAPLLFRAQKRQDYETLVGLTEFSEDTIQQAVILIPRRGLVRPEARPRRRPLAPAAAAGARRRRATPGAAKTSPGAPSPAPRPAGATPRPPLIGALVLEDIAAGLPLLPSGRALPLVGPSPTSAPGPRQRPGTSLRPRRSSSIWHCVPALARRYARLDEIQTVWRSARPGRSPPRRGGGVFGHLPPKAHKTQSAPPIDTLAPIRMTWEKFARTVLPTARAIRFLCRPRRTTTALSSPPRTPTPARSSSGTPGSSGNPFSWYLYVQQSAPVNWGLQPGTWCAVNAITLQPSMVRQRRALRVAGQGP